MTSEFIYARGKIIIPDIDDRPTSAVSMTTKSFIGVYRCVCLLKLEKTKQNKTKKPPHTFKPFFSGSVTEKAFAVRITNHSPAVDCDAVNLKSQPLT